MPYEFAAFIDEVYLKENSPISGNNDMGEIYPFAKSAEDTYIQEALGSRLFNRLIASLNASPQNYTANEAVLMTKIRACLVWYTCYDALPFLATKVRNIGVVKQEGPDIKSAEDATVRDLIKKCKDKGDFYLKLLQMYLCENSSLFPEYNCSGCAELSPNPTVSSSSDLAIDMNDNGNYDRERFYKKWLG